MPFPIQKEANARAILKEVDRLLLGWPWSIRSPQKVMLRLTLCYQEWKLHRHYRRQHRHFKKLKVELSWNPATPLLSVFIQKIRLGSPSDVFIPVFTAVLGTVDLVCAPPQLHFHHREKTPERKAARWHSRIWWERPKSWSQHRCLTKIEPNWDTWWPPCHLWFASLSIAYLNDF